MRRRRLTVGTAAALARPMALPKVPATPATPALCPGAGSSTRPTKPMSSASRNTNTRGAYAISRATAALWRISCFGRALYCS